MRTPVFGRILRIFRVASNPFISRMLMSMTIMSGRRCAARAIAARPLVASAQTIQPGLDHNSVLIPLRTTSWSSAINIRTLFGTGIRLSS
jgi:hypothetical protein